MDSKATLIQVRFWTLVFITGSAVIGLIMVIISLSDKIGVLWQSLLNQFGTILFVTGVWSAFYELRIRETLITSFSQKIDVIRAEIEAGRRDILDQVAMAKAEQGIGLVKVSRLPDTISYADLIENSKVLYVVLNDGRTWVSNFSESLGERIKDASKRTVFVLVHPDSPMVEVLAAKSSSDAASYRNKIKETVRILMGFVEDAEGDQGRISILGHHLYNSQSICLGDNRAVITPYFTSNIHRSVPVLVFERKQSGYFNDIEADIQALMKLSTPIDWLSKNLNNQKELPLRA